MKELHSCLEAGHSATVISFSFENWSKNINDELLNQLKGKAELITLPGDRKNKMAWIISSLVSLLSHTFISLNIKSVYLLSFKMFKRSWLLLQALQEQPRNFDIVIAHNPGAFVPAYHFAKKSNARLGIDIEDYHPGETEDDKVSFYMHRIMKIVLEHAQVITAASPMILEQSLHMIKSDKKKGAVIHNAFSLTAQPIWKKLSPNPLKLVWFSQNIGLNRGIQDAIEAMILIDEFEIQLSLIGNCSQQVKKELLQLLTTTRHTIVFIAPVNEKKLTAICSNHHLGLALETGRPENRDICLTNKLFVYLLAGNAILASRTKAQVQFMDQFEGVGKLYSAGDSAALASIFKSLYESPLELLFMRKAAFRLATERFNWELESRRFLEVYKLQASKVAFL